MQNLYFCIPVHRFFRSAYRNRNPFLFMVFMVRNFL